MKRIKCDQCNSAYINGVFCHEHGCPNRNKRYMDGEWVKVYVCDICGYEYLEGETCCNEKG